MNHIRIGDRVYLTHHMSKKGLVTEVFFRAVQANNNAGPFTKQMFVRFVDDVDGKEIVAKRQDVRKDD